MHPEEFWSSCPKLRINSGELINKKKIKKFGVLTSQNEERKIAISSKPLNLAP